MNPEYTEFKFPQIRAQPWNKVFRSPYIPSSAIDLLSRMLQYIPSKRLTPLQVR